MADKIPIAGQGDGGESKTILAGGISFVRGLRQNRNKRNDSLAVMVRWSGGSCANNGQDKKVGNSLELFNRK